MRGDHVSRLHTEEQSCGRIQSFTPVVLNAPRSRFVTHFLQRCRSRPKTRKSSTCALAAVEVGLGTRGTP